MTSISHVIFYDVNLTIRHWTPCNRRFYKGVFHEDITYQHPLFVNNSNNNQYFTNYSTNNRSVSANDQLNSKTNFFTKTNYIFADSLKDPQFSSFQLEW